MDGNQSSEGLKSILFRRESEAVGSNTRPSQAPRETVFDNEIELRSLNNYLIPTDFRASAASSTVTGRKPSSITIS
jgi:hypothetical protein